ncbi:MAG: c-type cytochrome [Aureliella sp.]
MNCDNQHQVASSVVANLAQARIVSSTAKGWQLRLKRMWLGGSLLVGMSVAGLTLIAFAKDSPTEHADASQSQIAHGKYLVHHVAQCIQCHTPRNVQGDLIESRLLTGAAIPVLGPMPGVPWAAESVAIAGLGNYSVLFVRHLLIHGKRPDGTTTKSPMPTFNLSQSDADAVIAYLKSR